MTMAIRCAVLALCALLVTQLAANAGGATFADLLARAKAQDAAGHRWGPPGDNMTETVMTMLDAISTATPDQLAELSALLQRDKPPANDAAPYPGSQPQDTPADTLPVAPSLASPTLLPPPLAPPPAAAQEALGLATTVAPSDPTVAAPSPTTAAPGPNVAAPGATGSVAPTNTDKPTPTPALATAEPPVTPPPDQWANQPSDQGQNSQTTSRQTNPSQTNPSQTTPSQTTPSQTTSRETNPSQIAPTQAASSAVAGTITSGTITSGPVAPARITPSPATPSPATPGTTTSATITPGPAVTPAQITPSPVAPPRIGPTPAEPVPTTADPQRAAMLFARGLDAERRGDISGARRFYATSARQGDAAAALNLGRLYDPTYLKQTALGGVDPNPELARFWYDAAAKLGDTGAAPLLEALSSR
ncbi:hypothetical protein [Rhodopila sp.]|uniref:hypothetical protein n=1 Tax=Rhodopila sp. TaxID=2480087 RepID=UPI003D0AB250